MFGNGRIREIAGAGQRESEGSGIGAGCCSPLSAKKRGTVCANLLSNPVRCAGLQTPSKSVGVRGGSSPTSTAWPERVLTVVYITFLPSTHLF